MNTRVLVVDDTALFRRIVCEALAGAPGLEVVGTAAHGKLALARMAALQPDIVTLDIEMPEMNGVEVLQAMGPAGLRAAVIMLSSLTVRGGEMTVRALELGAVDFLTKPEGRNPEDCIAHLRERLLPIIRAIERRSEIRSILRGKPAAPEVVASQPAPRPLFAAPPVRQDLRSSPPIVLVGVSTGGPAALAQVIPRLPADLGAPLFVVQHMPPMFTRPLAASLQAKSAIRVKEAEDGECAAANCAYIAPGGRQMKLVRGPRGEILVSVTDDPPENNCRPAVDYLFRSAAAHFPGRSIAAILTGMGNDGTAGLRLLKRGGSFTVAQDEATCVVFGMPREAILAGVVDTVAPLEGIAPAIVRAVREARQ